MGAHVYWTQPDSKAPVLYEAIGVVADVRAMPEEQAPYMMYVPYWVWPPWEISLVVRTNVDVRAVVAGVQQIIRRTDNQIAIPHVESLRNILNEVDSTAEIRYVARAAVRAFGYAFGGDWAVRPPFAIGFAAHPRVLRMALGAQTREIFRMVLSRGGGARGRGTRLRRG